MPQHRTVIYATRDAGDALAVSDRIVVLQVGTLLIEATMGEGFDMLKKRYAPLKTFHQNVD